MAMPVTEPLFDTAMPLFALFVAGALAGAVLTGAAVSSCAGEEGFFYAAELLRLESPLGAFTLT